MHTQSAGKLRRAGYRCVLSLSLLGAASALAAQPPLEVQPLEAEKQSVFRAVNKARSVARYCGGQFFGPAPALSWNGALARSAQAHAADMAKQGYFSHWGKDGRSIKERAEQAGYWPWRDLGENIAAGYNAAQVLQSWLDSPSHCQTLMDAQLSETGIGFVFVPKSPQRFYWVQAFGRR